MNENTKDISGIGIEKTTDSSDIFELTAQEISPTVEVVTLLEGTANALWIFGPAANKIDLTAGVVTFKVFEPPTREGKTSKECEECTEADHCNNGKDCKKVCAKMHIICDKNGSFKAMLHDWRQLKINKDDTIIVCLEGVDVKSFKEVSGIDILSGGVDIPSALMVARQSVGFAKFEMLIPKPGGPGSDYNTCQKIPQSIHIDAVQATLKCAGHCVIGGL